ncbi:MAG: zf-HC2 domain-containing protein [Nitrospirae bacterium]|nr:zf-HC2 domain-containing protein [Nitrospirota bacterium]
MDCNNIRNKLSAYLDDELSFRDREVVEKHLELCPACAREKKSLFLLSSLMDEIAAEDISPFFTEKVISSVKTDSRQTSKHHSLRSALACLGIIVLMLAGAGIFGSHYLNRDERDEYAYLSNFDDFPPDSFSYILIPSLRGKSR